MCSLKFHFKYSLYHLVFIEMLLPSTIHCKKTSCLLEFCICVCGLSNDKNNVNDKNNMATTYLVLHVWQALC